MSAVWFFAGYALGAVVAMAAIHMCYRIAERCDRRKGGTP